MPNVKSALPVAPMKKSGKKLRGGMMRINVVVDPESLRALDFISAQRYGVLNRSMLIRELAAEEADRVVKKGSRNTRRGNRR